jgi:hypothetical protein
MMERLEKLASRLLRGLFSTVLRSTLLHSSSKWSDYGNRPWTKGTITIRLAFLSHFSERLQTQIDKNGSIGRQISEDEYVSREA